MKTKTATGSTTMFIRIHLTISANLRAKTEISMDSGVLGLKAGYGQSTVKYRYLSLYAKKMGVKMGYGRPVKWGTEKKL